MDALTGSAAEKTTTWPGGALRAYVVDDGDGSGAEERFDVHLAHGGEAGSGGKLQRLTRKRVERLVSELQQALAEGQ